MCGIYMITNIKTKKVYVGQSIDINRRWSEHKARAFDSHNNCYDKPLYRSMRKHGIENFILSILCECTPEELNHLEAQYILQLNCVTPNGYNVQTAEEIDAPLRQNPKCKICGSDISKGTVHQLCRECYIKTTRKVERPTKEELNKLLHTHTFVAVGKMFGVSDNAIRKWCKQYNLSSKAKDYK